MHKIGSVLRVVVLAAVTASVVACSFLAGYGAHWASGLQQAAIPNVSTEPKGDEAEEFRLFWQGWHLLQQDYYGDLPGMQ
ncbi:MAG: hypothetical protein ACP5UM_13685, partial [Anaerolineae bacterium]